MLENMALPENEDKVVTSKPFYIQFARFISTAFSPAIITLPFILLVALYTHEANALLAAGIIVFFLSVGPMGYIFYGVKTGKFSDVDVSIRSQRTGPFVFGLASGLLGLLILELTHAPHLMTIIMLLILVCGVILMVTTFWWKISMHASAISGAVTMLGVLYGKIILPAFVLVALVGWSRVVLHRHTRAQVIGGSAVGILLTFALLKTQGL
jgi:membrane-associated phospholipid phosphatase